MLLAYPKITNSRAAQPMNNSLIMPKKALFLIDGSYLLYRSFFAIKPLHTAGGIPTNAVYGFCRAIKKLLDSFAPAYVGVVWDSKGGSFRNQVYPEYKANRQAPPSDLMMQKDLIMQFIDLVGICNVALPGFEADDLLATLARKKLAEQTVIVCADKDMYQLLEDPSVLITDIFKDEVFNAALYTQKKGYPPSKIPFYHALIGDASDNIPGVRGIGEKSATELVQAFESLDHLYQHLARVDKTRVRAALAADEANARLSLQLFSLAEAPLHQSLQDFAFAFDQWNRAKDFFYKYEFSSLANTIIAPIGNDQQGAIAPAEGQSWQVTIVDSLQAVEVLYTKLCAASLYSFDTETDGLSSVATEMVGMSFCIELGEAFYLPFSHPADGVHKNLDRAATLEVLRRTLENPAHKKVVQHAKFDMHVLRRHGVRVQGVVFDTLIAANLVKQGWATINLKDLSMRLLHERMETYEEVLGGKKYKHFGLVPTEHAAMYGAHDARQALALMPILAGMLRENAALQEYFDQIDMPFSDLLFRMEAAGITLDQERMMAVDAQVEGELKIIEEKLHAAVPTQQLSIGEEPSMNFNSPRQIEFLLFDVLKLPVVTKTAKGSRSTDQEVLEKLAKVHFIPGLLLKYREFMKLRSTYTQPLPKEVDPESGRIHTTFSQTLVATGRLSSSNPNLQNIPAYSEYGHAIRSAFVAAPGHVLMSADYSQIELRVLAHVSEDPVLCQAFHDGVDIHQQTAAQLLGIAKEAVTPQQRQLGKQLNFSIMYGLTPFGLSQDMEIPLKEAKIYIDGYFAAYKQVKAWMDRTVDQGIKDGFVTTLWGRRRYIPELRDKNRTVFEGGRRVAINTPIQGATADLMKVAMLQIDKVIAEKKLGSKLLLQIHDEIIFEVPEKEVACVENVVREVMEHVVAWRVPLKVALRTGMHWGEITK